jgi:hypothetical protein
LSEPESFPKESRFEPFDVGAEYMVKHNPKPGGYWVLYEGGYQSWSPAEAFEDGYKLLAPGAPVLSNARPMIDPLFASRAVNEPGGAAMNRIRNDFSCLLANISIEVASGAVATGYSTRAATRVGRRPRPSRMATSCWHPEPRFCQRAADD